MIVTKKEIASIILDPHLQTADVDPSNNYFPRRIIKNRFEFLLEKPTPPNPMQQQRPTPTP